MVDETIVTSDWAANRLDPDPHIPARRGKVSRSVGLASYGQYHASLYLPCSKPPEDVVDLLQRCCRHNWFDLAVAGKCNSLDQIMSRADDGSPDSNRLQMEGRNLSSVCEGSGGRRSSDSIIAAERDSAGGRCKTHLAAPSMIRAFKNAGDGGLR